MTRTQPEGWLELIQDYNGDDLKLATFLLRDLTHYQTGKNSERDDLEKVLALITAIRLHQLGKDTAA